MSTLLLAAADVTRRVLAGEADASIMADVAPEGIEALYMGEFAGMDELELERRWNAYQSAQEEQRNRRRTDAK